MARLISVEHWKRHSNLPQAILILPQETGKQGVAGGDKFARSGGKHTLHDQARRPRAVPIPVVVLVAEAMTLKLHHRVLQRGYLTLSRVSRGMTLGVRAMLLGDGGVTLVKHSYVPGWYLPGGGVEAGETCAEALAREIDEEAGVRLTGPAQLFGLYRNAHADKRDHVALFVCREWERVSGRSVPNGEIVAIEHFPLDALPEGTTSGTRARIHEVARGQTPPADW